jgi:hypothetical protein
VTEKDKKPLYINYVGHICVRYCVIEKDKEPLYINDVGVFVMFCEIEKDMN